MGIWRFMDSGDGFTSSEITTRYTSGDIQNGIVAGFGGRKAYNQPRLLKAIAGITGKRVVVGQLYNFTSLITSAPIGSIINISSAQLSYVPNADGSISFYRGAATLLWTTAPGILRTGVSLHLALDMVLDDGTSGSIKVYLNNSLADSNTALDTCNLTSGNNWTAVRRGGASEAGLGGSSTYIGQDFYVWNPDVGAGLPANLMKRIQRIRLAANGASHQFTSQTANQNWQNADDATQDGDTSTNKSTARGDIDEFTIVPINTGDTVVAVQVSQCGRLSDAGTAGLQTVVRQGGVNYLGASAAIGADYFYTPVSIYEDSPAALGLADATINGLQFGYKNIDAP